MRHDSTLTKVQIYGIYRHVVCLLAAVRVIVRYYERRPSFCRFIGQVRCVQSPEEGMDLHEGISMYGRWFRLRIAVVGDVLNPPLLLAHTSGVE